MLQTQENDLGFWQGPKGLDGGKNVEVEQVGDGGERLGGCFRLLAFVLSHFR